MPIRPDLKPRYPKDWPEISWRIKERAGWRCEFCGVAHGELGAWWQGTWLRATPKGTGPWDDPRRGGFFPLQNGVRTKITQIILTTAHLDHTPENCGDDNLKALCQRCHLRHDAKHHALSRRFNARRAAGCPDLFEGAHR